MQNITLEDVAKYAKVSRQTVSRAINNLPEINPETKKRVLEAVAELGYTPNNAARFLASGVSHTIGLISFAATEFGPAKTLEALEFAARKKGFSVIVGVVNDADELPELLNQMLSQNIVAAIVIAPSFDSAEVLVKQNPNFPVITTINSKTDVFKDLKQHYSVYTDQKRLIEKGVTFLKEKGYEKIIHIPGPVNWFDSDERKRWIKSYANKFKLELEVLENDSWYSIDGYNLMKEFLKKSKLGVKKTAVFAANDLIAIGAIRAATEQGVKIPDELGVIGIDNYGGTDCSNPPLTTLEQSFEETGTKAMELILKIIKKEELPAVTVLDSTLIERLSA